MSDLDSTSLVLPPSVSNKIEEIVKLSNSPLRKSIENEWNIGRCVNEAFTAANGAIKEQSILRIAANASARQAGELRSRARWAKMFSFDEVQKYSQNFRFLTVSHWLLLSCAEDKSAAVKALNKFTSSSDERASIRKLKDILRSENVELIRLRAGVGRRSLRSTVHGLFTLAERSAVKFKNDLYDVFNELDSTLKAVESENINQSLLDSIVRLSSDLKEINDSINEVDQELNKSYNDLKRRLSKSTNSSSEAGADGGSKSTSTTSRHDVKARKGPGRPPRNANSGGPPPSASSPTAPKRGESGKVKNTVSVKAMKSDDSIEDDDIADSFEDDFQEDEFDDDFKDEFDDEFDN